eukprot:gene2575-6062_t
MRGATAATAAAAFARPRGGADRVREAMSRAELMGELVARATRRWQPSPTSPARLDRGDEGDGAAELTETAAKWTVVLKYQMMVTVFFMTMVGSRGVAIPMRSSSRCAPWMLSMTYATSMNFLQTYSLTYLISWLQQPGRSHFLLLIPLPHLQWRPERPQCRYYQRRPCRLQQEMHLFQPTAFVATLYNKRYRRPRCHRPDPALPEEREVASDRRVHRRT